MIPYLILISLCGLGFLFAAYLWVRNEIVFRIRMKSIDDKVFDAIPSYDYMMFHDLDKWTAKAFYKKYCKNVSVKTSKSKYEKLYG